MVLDYDNMKIGINGDMEPVIEIYKDPLSLGGLPLWAVILLMVAATGVFLGLIAFIFIKFKYRALQRTLRMYD